MYNMERDLIQGVGLHSHRHCKPNTHRLEMQEELLLKFRSKAYLLQESLLLGDGSLWVYSDHCLIGWGPPL